MRKNRPTEVACSVCRSTSVRVVSQTRTTCTYVCRRCGWLRSVVVPPGKAR